ncbi:ribosome-recycling factor [Plasmodium gaboni]|uniref:Ribosome-recycling factor n=1 Tax=Plasmodium gaboni TaxID=647221 RepID=A0A151LWG1_9APIC|nr:ribosome-recycling factor [Plasmodium gaboni]KYO03518.1 ribosome-recycling factor [Plasmodium gaboni]
MIFQHLISLHNEKKISMFFYIFLILYITHVRTFYDCLNLKNEKNYNVFLINGNNNGPSYYFVNSNYRNNNNFLRRKENYQRVLLLYDPPLNEGAKRNNYILYAHGKKNKNKNKMNHYNNVTTKRETINRRDQDDEDEEDNYEDDEANYEDDEANYEDDEANYEDDEDNYEDDEDNYEEDENNYEDDEDNYEDDEDNYDDEYDEDDDDYPFNNDDIDIGDKDTPYETQKSKTRSKDENMTHQNKGANTTLSLENYKIKKNVNYDIETDKKNKVKKKDEEDIHETNEKDDNINDNNDDKNNEHIDDIMDEEYEEDYITEEDIKDLHKICSDKMNKVYEFLKKESYRFNLNNVSNDMFENEKVKINERIYTVKHICHIKKKENLFTITPYDPYFLNFLYQHFIKEFDELKFYVKDKSLYAVIPPISENLKNEIKMKIKKKIEDSKVTLRTVRKQMMDKLEKFKNKIGKDIYFKQKNYIQSIHDQTKKNIEKIFADAK